MSLTKDFTDPSNPYTKYWKSINNEDLPSNANNIIEIDFEEFKKKYHNYDDDVAKKQLFDSLLSGDLYLLKNAFPKKWLDELKNYVIKNKFEPENFEFHKTFDGVPNFSRNITPELAKNYSIIQIKTTSYFFPFNDEKESFPIYPEIYSKWKTLKFISGYKEDIWEKNIPSDGLIDRVQVVRYPLGTGTIEPHTDPYLYQRFVISSYFSKKGKDYMTGGFYAFDKNDNEIDVEQMIDPGDLCFCVATVKHGVHVAGGTGQYPEEDLRSGRWFLGIYTMESDYSNQRHTSSKLSK